MSGTPIQVDTGIRVAAVPSDLTSDAVYADVAAVIGGDMGCEITPASARQIASWWQSSGSVGHRLASFASGVQVDRDALLADIHATRVENHYFNAFFMAARDRDALDCLSTFVINYGRA